MTEFTDLSTLYEHLEQHAQVYFTSFEIGQFFNKLTKALKTAGNEGDAERAQWETDFFFVMFFEGESKPFSSMYDDKGERHEYPDLKKIDERQWSYLIERLETVTNPILKSRYSHILWCSPKKHGKYAQIAIDNYLQLIKIYENKDNEQPTVHFGLNALDCFKNAYHLSIIVNYRFDEIKSELKRLVTSFNPKSSSSPAVRTHLIKLALNDKKIFSKEDFTGFDILCDEIANIWISRDNIHAAIDIYELCERWENKFLGKISGVWRRKIAGSYESMMRNQIEREEYAIAVSFCIDAISNYKRVKDDKKAEELEQIYQQIKNKVEFKEFSETINLKEITQHYKTVAQNLMQRTPEEIIGFLVSDEKHLLPHLKVIKERAKKLEQEFSVRHIFPSVITDQQGNPAQSFRSDHERDNHSILEQYRFELELNNRVLIREILFAAIRENKLNVIEVIDFLKKHSWAGKNISIPVPNNQKIIKNWISLLAPAINEYCSQMNLYFINNSNIPNFILCIDSMTLKIEGLMRDFCSLNGIPTSSIKRDDIVREKLLNELLEEEKIKSLFSEDELFFLKFLLVEQTGYNLRHRVAHSLMIYQNYSVDYMNYLFIGMLRLCKYDIERKDESGSDKLTVDD